MTTQESLSKVPPFFQPSDSDSELNIKGKISKEDLATLPVFSPLGDREREKIASITNKKRFSRDALIFDNTDSGGQLFFVRQGEVKIIRGIGAHKEQTLSVAKGGDFFGIVSFLDGKEHSVSAACTDDSEIFVIDKSDFDGLVREDPVIGIKILKIFSPVVCSYLRTTNSKIKDLNSYVTSGE